MLVSKVVTMLQVLLEELAAVEYSYGIGRRRECDSSSLLLFPWSVWVCSRHFDAWSFCSSVNFPSFSSFRCLSAFRMWRLCACFSSVLSVSYCFLTKGRREWELLPRYWFWQVVEVVVLADMLKQLYHLLYRLILALWVMVVWLP